MGDCFVIIVLKIYEVAYWFRTFWTVVDSLCDHTD